MKDAALEQVDADLAAGRITEQQAEEAKVPGGHPGHGGPGHFAGGPGSLEAAADYLGLNMSELAEALRSGQTLAEIAEAKGKTAAGLKQAILDDVAERLDQAVSDGKITSAQKDDLLSRLESNTDDLIEGTLAGPFGFGRRSDLSGAPLPEAPQSTA